MGVGVEEREDLGEGDNHDIHNDDMVIFIKIKVPNTEWMHFQWNRIWNPFLLSLGVNLVSCVSFVSFVSSFICSFVHLFIYSFGGPFICACSCSLFHFSLCTHVYVGG